MLALPSCSSPLSYVMDATQDVPGHSESRVITDLILKRFSASTMSFAVSLLGSDPVMNKIALTYIYECFLAVPELRLSCSLDDDALARQCYHSGCEEMAASILHMQVTAGVSPRHSVLQHFLNSRASLLVRSRIAFAYAIACSGHESDDQHKFVCRQLQRANSRLSSLMDWLSLADMRRELPKSATLAAFSYLERSATPFLDVTSIVAEKADHFAVARFMLCSPDEFVQSHCHHLLTIPPSCPIHAALCTEAKGRGLLHPPKLTSVLSSPAVRRLLRVAWRLGSRVTLPATPFLGPSLSLVTKFDCKGITYDEDLFKCAKFLQPRMQVPPHDSVAVQGSNFTFHKPSPLANVEVLIQTAVYLDVADSHSIHTHQVVSVPGIQGDILLIIGGDSNRDWIYGVRQVERLEVGGVPNTMTVPLSNRVSYPDKISEHSAVVVNGTVFVGASYERSRVVAKLVLEENADGLVAVSEERLAELPRPRKDALCAAAGSHIYFFGGDGEGHHFLCFDLDRLTVTEVGQTDTLPPSRYEHGGIFLRIGQYLVLGAGCTRKTGRVSFGDCWLFDLRNRMWTEVVPSPFTGFKGSSIVQVQLVDGGIICSRGKVFSVTVNCGQVTVCEVPNTFPFKVRKSARATLHDGQIVFVGKKSRPAIE